MLIEGIITFVLRAILGVFLGYLGVLLGYLLGFLGVFSTPTGVGEEGGLQLAWLFAMAIGAGVGAILAWWSTDTDRRRACGVVLFVLCVACVGGWLGQLLTPIRIGPTPEGVQRIAGSGLWAVITANIGASVLYYRMSIWRRLETAFGRSAHLP